MCVFYIYCQADYYLVESVGSNMDIYLKSSAESLAACGKCLSADAICLSADDKCVSADAICLSACGKCLSSVSTRPWFPPANPCILQVINDYISVGV